MHGVLARSAAALLCSAFLAVASSAEEPTSEQDATEERQPARERVYGWELMTDEELAEHRTRMRNAKTREEREQIRREHHAKMLERAEEQGVELIGPRPGRRRGVGAGPGPGPGLRRGPR